MAERDQESAIEERLTLVRSEAFALKWATIGTVAFPLSAVAAATALAALGKDGAAAVTGLAAIVSGAGQVLWRARAHGKASEEQA